MKPKRFFRKVLVIVTVAWLLPALCICAGDKPVKTPEVKKGANVTMASGTLIQWKDLKKISFTDSERRRMKPILNFKDPRQIKRTGDQPDPVVQSNHPLKRESKALTTPIMNFDGMDLSNNGSGWPPDPNGDVGVNYYIQTVNTSIGIYNKSTGALVSATTFDAFFPSSVGSPCDNENNGDPIVLYDQYNQRWFILDFAWSGTSNGSFYSIAASQTSDPTGAWWTYCFRADSTLMNDYPKCGIWSDGIYITANMFQFSGSFEHIKVWAIKTPDLYNGTITSQDVTDSGFFAFSLMPSNARGSATPPSGSPNYLYSIDADEWGTGYSDALKVWKYSVDWNNSANTTWTGPASMDVAAYGLVATGVPQSGTSNTLDSLYGRLMYSAIYRNYGTHESVYLSHLAEYSSRRAMRWYEVRISSGNSSIYQQGTYSPDATHRWMGSVCADGNGNIAMGYSASSSTMYPAIRYCGRLNTDTLGTMGQGEQTMHAGTGSQTTYNRWGDYTSLSIDPVDDTTFWYTNEYLSSTGTNWKTRIGSFQITSGTIPGDDDLEDAVDNNNLTFTTSGSADWARVTDVYYYDNDSAKSGTISHSQTSSMSTTITLTETKSLKFYWKVSSESTYDFLRFYIDGTLQDQISGTVDWTQQAYDLAAGSHTLTWTYYKDASVSTGSDCGWVDKVELDVSTTPGDDTLEDALDNSDVTIITAGDGNWYYQTATAYYDGDAAQSPVITHDEAASMTTTISGATSVKFFWKVSSEANYDYLEFYIDGTLQDRISGSVDWAQKNYTVSTGTHTLTWTYDKDYSVSSGSDCGWVDKLELGTGTVTDPIAVAVDYPTLTFSLSGSQQWYVTTGDYYYGGTSVTVPAALNHNQSATMETTISGFTTVKFYWKVSSEANYDYLKFYIDGVLQDQISGTVNWQQKIYSVTSTSHTLKWVYSKDYSVSSGSDTGWVDLLQLQ